MRLRTFTAPNMPAAMKLVREALGEDAIIIATGKGNSKNSISVTAAIDFRDEESNQPSAIKRQKEKKPSPAEDQPLAGDLRYEIQNILRFHNLPELFVAKLMQKATDTDMQGILGMHRISGSKNPGSLERLALEKMLSNYFAFEPLQQEATHRRIMLIGAPGIGKTLTVAKMAAKLVMEKQQLAVFTTDNKRAGGIEQLKAFTDILNVPLKIVSNHETLSRQLSALAPRTQVIIDTAGCNPYDASELEELKALASTESIRPVLVMAAGGDSSEAIDMAEAFTALPITRLLVTRADTAKRLGGVIAAAAAHGLAFCNANSSGSITHPLQPFDAALLAKLLLQYRTNMNSETNNGKQLKRN